MAKNYYEIFGINPNITEEQIWEKFVEIKEKFDRENPASSEEEKKEIFRRFHTILWVLTEDKERERYDKHLVEFGSDENFQPNFDFTKPEDYNYITNKVLKKYEERIEKLEFKKWMTFYKKRESLRRMAEKNKEWRCNLCQYPYEKLIIFPAEEIPNAFKYCLTCFSYIEGKMVGKGHKEPNVKIIKVIKELEKEWELTSPFKFISYRKIAEMIEENN